MKVLYAIQGTGNGHICRARDIIPILQKKVELDILISGTQVDIDLPCEVNYKFKGLSFIFGKKGGVNLFDTWKKNKIRRFFKEVKSVPVQKYDLVINDFEPVSAWACQQKKVACISLSHQSAVLSKNAPRPKHLDPVGKHILKYYAPSNKHLGFHFKRYNKKTFTPIIREEVRQGKISNKEHYTVYLPAYTNEKIHKVLSLFPHIQWHIFSKHNKDNYSIDNIKFQPINNEKFIESMLSAKGVLCGAGFETPAEVLFLQKKLLVIPMKSQYEQHCNAAALKELGVPVLKSLKVKHVEVINKWLQNDTIISVNYPNETEEIIDFLLNNYADIEWTSKDISLKDFLKNSFENK